MKITSIPLPYEQEFALRDLLDAGLQNFCTEIEEASGVATAGGGWEGGGGHTILLHHAS